MIALILEREEDILELLSYNLAKAGYQVTELDDEAHFDTKLTELNPKLVLIGNVGHEKPQSYWCKLAHATPGHPNRRIVCLTTNESEQKDIVQSTPAHSCILTPITPKKLVQTLDQLWELDPA